MNKKEVLVDTVFLEKLSCDGKNLDTFKKVLSDLDFKPVVHWLDVFLSFFQNQKNKRNDKKNRRNQYA